MFRIYGIASWMPCDKELTEEIIPCAYGVYNAEAGEVGQLHYLCERIGRSRKTLLRQREDIETALRDMDQIEAQCRATLERLQTAS